MRIDGKFTIEGMTQESNEAGEKALLVFLTYNIKNSRILKKAILIIKGDDSNLGYYSSRFHRDTEIFIANAEILDISMKNDKEGNKEPLILIDGVMADIVIVDDGKSNNNKATSGLSTIKTDDNQSKPNIFSDEFVDASLE